MILMKALKPARLRDKDMRLTLLNAMRAAGKEIKQDFERTTKTWEHKPVFEVLISLTGPGPVVFVGTDDTIYGYINAGTKEHDIWAGFYTGKSNKKTLAFPGTFSAKTTPGVIDSRAGSRGGETVLRPYVHHPGTAARHFDETIQKQWQARFKRLMEEAMQQAARQSGHGG